MPDDPINPERSHEIVHNMNTGRFELREYGKPEPHMTARTASEIAQMAADAGLHVRLVAGTPAQGDPIAAARQVDMDMRGMKPPPVSPRTSDPGAHYELDALAADLFGAAAVDATPEAQAQPGPHVAEPELPTAESEAARALDAANRDWLAAWDAERKARAALDEQLAKGVRPSDLDDELLLQLQIAGEALNAAEAKLAASPGWTQALRQNPDEGPDDPEAEADLTAEPDPPKHGPTGAALDEPEAELRAEASAEPTPMPTEHVALDAPEPDARAAAAPLPGQVGSPEHAEAMAFAEAQLAPRGTPIAQLALEPLASASPGRQAAIIAARAFPDADRAAIEARPQLARSARPAAAKARLGKVLKSKRR